NRLGEVIELITVLAGKIQRRMGMMWASRGWSIEISARTISRAPRILRTNFRIRRRSLELLDAMPVNCIKAYWVRFASVAPVFGHNSGVNGSRQQRQGQSIGEPLMTRKLEAREGTFPEFLFDQHIVSIEGGDGEDGDSLLGKWSDER